MRVWLIVLLFVCALPANPGAAASRLAFGYPLGLPDRMPGDGVYIRDGYAVENTWYKPRWWHTGEDWYVTNGSTENALVYAVADGDVVYAGSNYPGRVVIVRHDQQLFSMYGHLDPRLRVRVGQQVKRGDTLGVVRAGWKQAPAHLHFELRTFLTTRVVNGAKPRYGYACGVDCPPGPGYWPIDAPEHPTRLGWRNPAHMINRQLASSGEVVVVSEPISPTLALWSSPVMAGETPRAMGEITITAGQRFGLLAVQTASDQATGTSAEAYHVWYHLRLDDKRTGWVQALVPSREEVGADGRAAAVRLNLVPVLPPDARPARERAGYIYEARLARARGAYFTYAPLRGRAPPAQAGFIPPVSGFSR